MPIAHRRFGLHDLRIDAVKVAGQRDQLGHLLDRIDVRALDKGHEAPDSLAVRSEFVLLFN